jgi:hypothetical protein
MPVKKEMSFLPSAEDVNSLSARIIRWLTTVGRFVIVFTELIVICAFLSRFWLDRTNSDLSEIIRQQKAIIDSTTSFEKDYSQLQKRLKLIKKLYASQPDFRSRLETLVESTPEDITFTGLSISHDPQTNEISATVNLVAFQETSIVNFISNLMVNPNISTVDIKTIEKKPNDARYNINLTLIFSKST